MTRERHERLEALFHAALGVPAAERDAWLDAECRDDNSLRAELAGLLACDTESGDATVAPLVRFTDEALPDVIGPYRLGARLGEGGFGEVYSAEQEAPVRRRVALKVLKPGMDSRAVLARFEAERQTLALMDHPSIARVLDAGVTPQGRPYFVMERVDGEPISAFCERHRLATHDRIGLVVAVCRAVEHAHQKGVIHRDLKPSNILVTSAGGSAQPKIIDFGIAKATGGVAGDTLHTREGEFLGTPEYASPEQMGTGGLDVDTRTDVYALGAVLYRLLTGQSLFDPARLRAVSFSEIARIVCEEEPPRPSLRAAEARHLRGDLDWITMKALEKDRDRRYASAAALAEDLERYLRHEPVTAGPPTTLYRVRKFVRRRRGLVVATAGIALALVGGLLATGTQAIRARRAEEGARREARTATAVSAFLARMLTAANPERNPRGAAVTVREVVDEAARELDATGAPTPELEAGLRQALGTTYMGLGLYEPARPQLERAALLREGGDPERWLEARLALAELEIRRGGYPAAESLLAALATSATASPFSHVRFLRLRGDNFVNLGRADEADSLLAAAVVLARGAGGDSLQLVGALGDRARARVQAGRMDEAEALAREGIAILRRVRSGDDYDVASMLGVLANILEKQGRYAEAERTYRDAEAIHRRVLGPGHPAVAYALANRAVVLEQLGRYAEAESSYRAALGVLGEALGTDHPEVIAVTGNFATVLQDAGQYDQALILRREVLDQIVRARGPGHPDAATAWNNLGSLLRLMKRYGEAEAAFRRAIEGFRGALGARHPLVAVAMHNLGKTWLDAGRAAEAESQVKEALAIGAGAFPPGHVNLALFTATHARALTALGRCAEAERELVPAREQIVATFGAGHPRAIEATVALADLYAKWGRTRDARRWRAAADSLEAGRAGPR